MSEEAIFKALGGGGVALFAYLVLHVLRDQTPVLKAIRDELFELRVNDATRFERDRRRDERVKRESVAPPIRGRALTPPPRGEFDAEETTAVEVIREQVKAQAVRPNVRTPAAGIRIPRPGTHHDEDR